MTREPALRVDLPRAATSAVALVLHGGREHSLEPTRPNHLAVLRMVPFATALRGAGSADGLAVARLRYVVRGWNGERQSPIADARWAVAELGRRFPGAPIALVGHSMGGRTALYVAGEPAVRAVVALAPWLEKGDPVEQLAGRRVLIAHGEHDRLTSPVASAAYARRAGSVAEAVTFVRVGADRHAMLRRSRVWHELTAGFVMGSLYGSAPQRQVGKDTAAVLTKALAGEASLIV